MTAPIISRLQLSRAENTHRNDDGTSNQKLKMLLLVCHFLISVEKPRRDRAQLSWHASIMPYIAAYTFSCSPASPGRLVIGRHLKHDDMHGVTTTDTQTAFDNSQYMQSHYCRQNTCTSTACNVFSVTYTAKIVHLKRRLILYSRS